MYQSVSLSKENRNLDNQGVSGPYARDELRQPSLLIIARDGIVSDALTGAVERAFPWLSVKRFSDPEEVRRPATLSAQLVLIDRDFLAELGEAPARWTNADPNTTIALLAPAHFVPDDELLDLIATGTVSGVLPTDVNLDIWLSIILIMLKGGEYFPPHMFRSFHDGRKSGNGVADERFAESTLKMEPETEESMLENLTAREKEVLGMVAQGHQNKIIAADLQLSENTVKIHIHNIIRKLGVHNRTEAAALYFAHDRGMGDKA
ncbi:helix-turn-helix transcriptional regulator [Oricola cellulosilytica]|uniref:Response regulator transcription factor n=1 Tax=Oricola cellulosilytica TaxID=1429082 RepID=A0A4R0PAD1_9HYPH|nr:response regulator transcription factor [Oricola cellulosilytica]TCD14200.1 response regulator transcription factor [Oricola cellulosilytica]